MRLILHHTVKDLRALWPLLAVWAGVLAAHLLLPDLEPGEGYVRAERLRTALQMIHWALAAVLPAMLILQDPVDGTRSFWFTRPISRGALLASKVLSVTVFFLVLPLAIQLAGLLRAGLGGWPLAAGMAEAGLHLAGISLGFAALASLTSSLARYVLVLAVYSGVAAIFVPALVAFVPQPWGPPINWMSLSNSRAMVSIVLLLVMAVAVLAHQWFTRRTYRSLVLVGLAVVATSCARVWPWDFLSQPARPLESATSFDLAPADDPRCVERGSDPLRIALCGRFVFPDPVADGSLEVQRIQSRLVLPDGTSIEHRARGFLGRTYTGLVDPAEPGGDPALTREPGLSEVFQTLLHPTRQQFHQHSQTPGVLEIDLVLASFEVERLGALPVEEGARYRAGTTAAAVERVTVSTGPRAEVDLALRMHSIRLLFTPDTWSLDLDARPEHRMDGQVFYLTSSGTSGAGRFLPLPRPNVRSILEQQTLSLRDGRGPSASGDETPVTAEEVRRWLRDVEIVLRHQVHTGTYHASVRMDGFRMADYAPDGAG